MKKEKETENKNRREKRGEKARTDGRTDTIVSSGDGEIDLSTENEQTTLLGIISPKQHRRRVLAVAGVNRGAEAKRASGQHRIAPPRHTSRPAVQGGD